MKVYQYTGVYDIQPGKNIVLFCGRFQRDYYNITGTLVKDKYTRSVIRNTYTGDSDSMRVISTRAYPKARDIDILLGDSNGTTQQIQYTIKGCGKGNVLGHHHRLTVQIIDYPTKDIKGKAISARNGMVVPFKGPQLHTNLKEMVRKWLYELFSHTTEVFFNPELMLDILERERVVEEIDMGPYIPLRWNPLRAVNIPDDLKNARDNLMQLPRNIYRQMTYADNLLTYMTRDDDKRISIEQMIDLELIPCYPVFSVSPYGPRMWDEDKFVRYAGVLQKTPKNNTNFSNHTLCKKIERWIGTKVDADELLAAAEETARNIDLPQDIFPKVEIQNCQLYFLGVTEQEIRKENPQCI